MSDEVFTFMIYEQFRVGMGALFFRLGGLLYRADKGDPV